MIIYRPHRGRLDKALAEAKEFQTEEEMKQYIFEYYNNLLPGLVAFQTDDIVIDEETVDDDRCGWHDTKYVCVKRLWDEDYMEKYGCAQCIGMCATNYERRGNEE